MQRTRIFCVALANYHRSQKAGETTFIRAFGIRTIESGKDLDQSNRTPAREIGSLSKGRQFSKKELERDRAARGPRVFVVFRLGKCQVEELGTGMVSLPN